MKLFIILGAINAFLSVAFGAFGAHILRGKNGTQVHRDLGKRGYVPNASCGWIVDYRGSTWKITGYYLLSWSGWLMFIGIVLFSGSLYVLSVTQISVLGAITPLGGVAFLAAWVLVIIAAVKYL